MLLAASACARSDRQATWPQRPVRLIVPHPPGTSADLAARLFAPLLSERWHRPVVVDNRPGGDGVIGTRALVASRDQHTLLFAPMGVVTTSPLLHELSYDPVRDLVPIAAAGRPSLGIAAASATGVESLAALVERVRGGRGELLWSATPGLPELVFRAFLKLEHLQMTHVAYGDVTAAVRDLAAGRLHVMVAALPTLHPATNPAHARLLAVTNPMRATAAPGVPTAAEAGYPALTVGGPLGFFGWRDMPDDLRRRIAEDVRQAAGDPALVSRLAKVGFVVGSSTPEEFAQEIEAQREQVEGIARILGLIAPVGAAAER